MAHPNPGNHCTWSWLARMAAAAARALRACGVRPGQMLGPLPGVACAEGGGPRAMP